MNYEQAKAILDKLLDAGEANKNERDSFTIEFLKDADLTEKEKISLLLSIKKRIGEWDLGTYIAKLNDNDKIIDAQKRDKEASKTLREMPGLKSPICGKPAGTLAEIIAVPAVLTQQGEERKTEETNRDDNTRKKQMVYG